jgi:hypothetical protein
MRAPILPIAAVLAAVVAASAPACSQRYASPCTVGAPVAIDVPGATPSGEAGDGGTSIAPALVLVDAPGGEIVATTLGTTPARGPDGGAPDGGGPDGGAPSGSLGTAPIPSDAEVVVVDATGVARRSIFAAPEALAARRGSTTAIGAVWTGAGVVWHWAENAVATQPNGAVDATATSSFAFVGPAGGETSDALHDETCAGCIFSFASATTSSGALVFYDRVSALSGGGVADPDAARAPRFLAFARDGALAASGLASWLGTSGGQLRVRSAGDRVIVTRGTTMWSVDDRAQPIAGPVRMPAPVGVATFWGAGGDIAMAWASQGTSSLPGYSPVDETGGSGAAGVGAESDILLERLSDGRDGRADGGIHGAVERVSTGGAAHAITREGEGSYGIVTSSIAGDLFVLADPGGRKIGGDVPLGAAAGSGSHVLRSPSPRTFVDVSSSGTRLIRRTITCAR